MSEGLYIENVSGQFLHIRMFTRQGDPADAELALNPGDQCTLPSAWMGSVPVMEALSQGLIRVLPAVPYIPIPPELLGVKSTTRVKVGFKGLRMVLTGGVLFVNHLLQEKLIIPIDVAVKAIERAQPKIDRRCLFGCPTWVQTPRRKSLHDSSHIVRRMWVEGYEVKAAMEMVSTDNGMEIQELIQKGMSSMKAVPEIEVHEFYIMRNEGDPCRVITNFDFQYIDLDRA